MPNIENDLQEFEAKTRLVVRNASACMTLTGWARERVTAMVAESLERPVAVLPHGFAVEPGRYPTGRRLGDHSAVGVYGALRPNRALDAVAAAWRALARRADRDERVGLKILLRSVSASDVGRLRPRSPGSRAAHRRTGVTGDDSPTGILAGDLVRRL